ncbi:MAG TPA: PAS-domain containing protein [Rhodopila sp.]|nr:PAS-domain containing protein [Rhodopila sp.]
MTQTFRQGVRVYGGHVALIGLVIVLLWGGIGFTLWHDQRGTEQAAENDAANLARAFDENITRTIEAVDQTLLFLRDAYQHDPAGFAREPWPSAYAFLDDLHVQLSLADRSGAVIWSNLGVASPDVSIADRVHFQIQQASSGDRLFISRPVLGRISGKWTIQFTRKLFAPDGSFAGVAVVSLDPHYLSRFYRSISIGNGSIVLATIDGTALARVPENASLLGGDLPAATRARILHATTEGSYRTVSGIDHVERIFSSRRLQRYPLILAVGLATRDVFAAYRRNRQLYLMAGTLLSAISIAVGLVMIRQRHSLVASGKALTVTLESMSQGIAMIDAEGNVPVLNQRAVDLLGLPKEWVTKRTTYREIVAWQTWNHELGDGTERDAAFGRARRLADDPHGDYTYERTRPNGTVLEVRTQSLPDGAFVRTYTDITERKRNEAALTTARARAAHAERMQVLGQLAGGIAHDFNNILQAVQGSASLIPRRSADAESISRFTEMILDATDRGASITRRLLAFARRGELRAEPVQAAALLSGLRDVLRHTLGRPISVELRLAACLPPLLADKGQLETTLVTLANNARDAMPAGGTLTFIAATEVVDSNAVSAADLQLGRYVRLSVADTGCGMDEATLSRAQEPFFSTKPQGQGTGLGLSMAKGFVEQSGGALSIETILGRGTTVHLWLPATTRTETLPISPVRPLER